MMVWIDWSQLMLRWWSSLGKGCCFTPSFACRKKAVLLVWFGSWWNGSGLPLVLWTIIGEARPKNDTSPALCCTMPTVRMNVPWRLRWSEPWLSSPWALIGSKLHYCFGRYKMGRPTYRLTTNAVGSLGNKIPTGNCCSLEFCSFLPGGRISCHWDGATVGIATNHCSLLSLSLKHPVLFLSLKHLCFGAGFCWIGFIWVN